jgi:hypothetical protein
MEKRNEERKGQRKWQRKGAQGLLQQGLCLLDPLERVRSGIYLKNTRIRTLRFWFPFPLSILY